ncbi:hypothetical protein [Paraburkholderia phenazinium]|uniref:Histone H1-like nucleoprotein HC2 n=1 Tax=Paraburkholderia phenazinium TaxID=60549 RepID=A0A1N6HF14_9BURK|nr:hypothetical protein [Paraburkholderia phenazinium]SIO18346.1 hypothetical protein SAMN05444168_3228 [Paraburkholderia phenazinium]
MNEPSLKKPTKKTFHFPKSATADATADASQTDAVVEVTAKPEKTKGAAAPKASRRKSAEKAAAAPKTETAVKERATPKAEAVAKEKAAPKSKAAPKQKSAPKEKAADASVAAAEKPKRAKKETAKKVVAKTEVAKKEVAKKEVAKKEKVVRDSFTMPKSDYAKIAALKQKCLEVGISVKKSEVLRAGLLLLEGATSQRLLAAISAVETVKTGRPAKS